MNGLIVRSEDFSIHQNIGNVVDEAKRFNEWKVDELICLDISREKKYDLGRDDHKQSSYSSLPEILDLVSKVCFMPLAFGGGVRTMEHVDALTRGGADKVVINTKATENHRFISEVADKYGKQAVVVSIDYRLLEGKPVVFSEFGNKRMPGALVDWITECEKLGAGEIFLNCIDRDGKGKGYDIETIGRAVESTKLPVVACGGAGDMMDLVELAKQTKVSGIAAGNIFHFKERSYPKAKQLLKEHGINVR